MKTIRKHLVVGLFILITHAGLLNMLEAQTVLGNVYARHTISLNGNWKVIIDPAGAGDWRQVWKDKKPEKKTEFYEYSFDEGPVLHVPGDFNSQQPELCYYENTVWYKKTFTTPLSIGKRYFIYFGAVNYKADVYLNGNLLGSHEGGFTPFQFEITSLAKKGENSLIVRVNNQKMRNGIPGMGYDWLNYGGITRDVFLIETAQTYVEDYFIQLKKHSLKEIQGWVKVAGQTKPQKIVVKIPELKLSYSTQTDRDGLALVQFAAKPNLWSPENPTTYKIQIQSETDTVSDQIGFRSIETQGTKIILNGKTLFLKGVNIHEENPYKMARAYSDSDAWILLTWAKELGCNFVRLAHYPHNENMVKMAEKMGLLVWEEIPVYQRIDFSDRLVPAKMDFMLKEMIQRDKNRCATFVWSISNETSEETPNRDNALIKLMKTCRSLDSTRLIASVFCNQRYENNTVSVWDSLNRYFDIIAINEYLGWYVPWQGRPEDVKWNMICKDKPVIISEFGGEALHGSKGEPRDAASSWSEEYQEQIYKDQLLLFRTIPGLSGVCPWLLVDYRSLVRIHPVYQKGWNRKGLLSEKGEKKKAWYIMKTYYDGIKNE